MRDEAAERLAAAQARWHVLEEGASLAPSPGGAGVLSGLVVGVKANIAVAGHACTAGLASRSDAIAGADAPAVAMLRAAGAGLVARLGMDEGAFGASGDNPHYGRTRNPAAPSHSMGGSSSGAGAAVACGAVDAALGSDTLGSVRIPAAYGGVWGLKPGLGVLPIAGVVPLAPRFDTLGLLARTPEVLGRVLAVMTGMHGVPGPVRVHVLPDLAEDAPPVRAGMARAVAATRALGWDAGRLDWPALDRAALRRAAFRVIAAAAVGSLGGETAASPGLQAALAHARGIDAGRVAAAEAVLADFAASVPVALGVGDLVLSATVPEPAFVHGAPTPSTQALHTGWVNALGWPALALPVPGDGLPVSVQLVGVPGSEATLLAAGAALHAAMLA